MPDGCVPVGPREFVRVKLRLDGRDGEHDGGDGDGEGVRLLLVEWLPVCVTAGVALNVSLSECVGGEQLWVAVVLRVGGVRETDVAVSVQLMADRLPVPVRVSDWLGVRLGVWVNRVRLPVRVRVREGEKEMVSDTEQVISMLGVPERVKDPRVCVDGDGLSDHVGLGSDGEGDQVLVYVGVSVGAEADTVWVGTWLKLWVRVDLVATLPVSVGVSE